MVMLAAACVSPAERFDDAAATIGLRAGEVAGAGFQHRTYASPPRPGPALHVYLDGDGTPFLGGLPAVDPTARDPRILDLLARDPAPAVLLGRPCYHGRHGDPWCDASLWTSHRYGEAVVTSLAAATARLLAEAGHSAVVLIGHSGGGTLAMLVAERVPQTVAVVTIAANLDTEAWSARFGHRPLAGSLNPASRPPLPPTIRQAHFAGAGDTVVPPAMTARGVRGSNATLTVIEGFDHRCCWADIWPELLAAALAGRGTAAAPGL